MRLPLPSIRACLLTARSARLTGLLVAAALGCKHRDPEAPGLFADGEPDPSSAESAPESLAWQVACRPTEERSADSVAAYRLEILMAKETVEDRHRAVISARRESGTATTVVIDSVAGEARLGKPGPIFVGYSRGALTGEESENEDGVGRHYLGVLTLEEDEAANGLAVDCIVSPKRRQGAGTTPWQGISQRSLEL